MDAQEGLTTIDQALAQKLRKANSNVVLSINKVDHEKHDKATTEMTCLGLGNGIEISAEHGRGFADLTQRIDEILEPLVSAEESSGKR